MAAIRFKSNFLYNNAQWKHSSAAAGANAETAPRIDGANGGIYRLVSRNAILSGGEKFTHRIQKPNVPDGGLMSFGLSSSPFLIADYNLIEHRVINFAGLGGTANGGAYKGDLPTLNNADVWTWERVGTSLVCKLNGVTKGTWTDVTAPLYFHIYMTYNGAPTVPFAVYDAQIVGNSQAVPAASAAPIISATAGHKRNHIAITYPSGANGVSIYRSTTNGVFDADAPIITEWRYPYFEDTGLTNGTQYYYTAKATIDGLSESAASAQVSATPALNAVPPLPENIGFIIGSPQVKPIGDATALEEQNFDYLEELLSMRWGLISPNRATDATIAGTVSVAADGKTVTGTGTAFLTDYKADGVIRIIAESGAVHLHYVKFVYSDTKLELWTDGLDFTSFPKATAYLGGAETGLAHRPHYDDPNINLGRVMEGIHYYDLTLSLYHCYYRTGSPYHLEQARIAAEFWRAFMEMYTTSFGGVNPRSAALAGVAIRAIEVGGLNTYWTAVKSYTDAKAFWITNPINNNGFYYVRDEAYIIQYTAIIGKAHPTESVRTAYATTAVNYWLNYFNKQQELYTDRVPRMDDFDFPASNEVFFHYHQPFIDAIAAEACIMIMKLAPANTAIKNNFLTWMTAAIDQYDNRMTVSGFRMRNPPYAAYQSVQPWDGVTPYTVPAAVLPYDPVWQGAGGDKNVAEPIPAPDFSEGTSRFLNCITIQMFGMAYHLSGNEAFRTHGRERLNASFGGQDGISARSDIVQTGKNTNEAFRRSPSALPYFDVIPPLTGGGGSPATSALVYTWAEGLIT